MTLNSVGLIFTKIDGYRTSWQISIMVDYFYSRIGIMMFELVVAELASWSRQLQGLRGLARLFQASLIYRHS